MTEDDVLRLIRDQFGTLIEERGMIFPTRSLAKIQMTGAIRKGVAFYVPDSTAGRSIVVSNGDGTWDEFVNVGPVS